MPSKRFCGVLSDAERAEFEGFIHALADAAFAVIDRYFLTGVAIEDKANGTPVTCADREAESAMRAMIERSYPAHGIFGEEWGVKEPAPAAVRYRWILDPVDGTRSFITNAFLFGTLIALERDDGDGFRPVLSLLGHAAAGARLVGSAGRTELSVDNGRVKFARPARVRACERLADATLLTTSHWTTPEQKGDARMQALIDGVKLYRTMGDCFGYFAVATGGADVMVDPDLSYWDVAALLPVVEGAGGVLTSVRGGNPLEDLSAVCTAGGVHAQVLALLNG
ncbi:MAG: inositol monophosphatase [Duodenibacillus sp.]|nr:inositol monophosphatase [Duodenibacillus sp.]